MLLSEIIKELGRIKHNCNCMTFEECLNGSCPYHGDRREGCLTFGCMFEDSGMGQPCEWEMPEEI